MVIAYVVLPIEHLLDSEFRFRNSADGKFECRRFNLSRFEKRTVKGGCCRLDYLFLNPPAVHKRRGRKPHCHATIPIFTFLT